jgi:hypothetical protein
MLRADLADVGVGTGRYGFQLHFSRPLDPRWPHSIVVRRVSDGAVLPNAPWQLAPAPSSQPRSLELLTGVIAADIEAAHTAAVLSTMTRFMVEQTDRVLQAACDIDNTRRDRALFRRRWAETLGGEPLEVPPPDARPMALFIDLDLPDGPAERALLAGLQVLGLRVAVVAARGMVASGTVAEALREADILVQGAPLHFTVEDVLRRHAGEFRLVVMRGAIAASAYAMVARLHQPRARILAWLDDPAQDPTAGIAAQLLADAVVTGTAETGAALARRVQGREVHVVPLDTDAAARDVALARAVQLNPGLLNPTALPDPS